MVGLCDAEATVPQHSEKHPRMFQGLCWVSLVIFSLLLPELPDWRYWHQSSVVWVPPPLTDLQMLSMLLPSPCPQYHWYFLVLQHGLCSKASLFSSVYMSISHSTQQGSVHDTFSRKHFLISLNTHFFSPKAEKSKTLYIICLWILWYEAQYLFRHTTFTKTEPLSYSLACCVASWIWCLLVQERRRLSR